MNKTFTRLIFVLLPVVVLGGMWMFTRDMRQRNREYPTQMGVSPASHSQTANPALPNGMTLQLPPPGTIPRGFKPFHYGPEPAEAKRAGSELENPFKGTETELKRGEYVFTNSCAVCHGPGGAGDGPIVPKFPNPPAFATDTSKALSDGELFHVITRGRNNMPAQESVISTEDRWKVILHIRKLQKKEQ